MSPLLLKALPFAATAGAVMFGVWYVHGTGYRDGVAEVRAEWNAETARAAAELLRIAEENQKRVITLQEAKHENLNTIETLRGDVAGLSKRLRVPKPACPKVPEAPASGGSVPEPTPAGGSTDKTQEAFDRFTERLGADAAEYDRVMENCRVVVEYIKALANN